METTPNVFFVRPFRLFIFCITFSLISILSFAQIDSVFLKNQIKPVIGKAVPLYKQNAVSVNSGGKKQLISFADIVEIRNANGKYYVNKSAGTDNTLFVLLVEGPFSLLFNEKNKLFYIEKRDSMLVISQQHMNRALPIIFGKELVNSYYAKSNIKAQYSARYLKNLTLFANQSQGAYSKLFEESLSQMKTSIRIGPYAGYSFNRTAFDLNSAPTGLATNKRTEYGSSNSIPLGLRVDIDLSKRIGINLDAYINNTTAKNLLLSNTGFHAIPFPNSIIIPEKYDKDLKITGFSSRTFHLDLSMTIALNRDLRSKIKPYVFVGPSVAFMLKNDVMQAAGYQETPESEMGYFYRWSKLDAKKYLVGFNVGLGVDYTVTERVSITASVKYLGGIYQKMMNRSFLPKTRNDTTVPDSSFGVFNSHLFTFYDQHVKMVSVGLAATYKF
ncbi:hypothetical protein [Dyadobacter chenhuakuii]|uniref:Outer membrane protein beta-barrel domain-containing protein n=1 Tax=Dyadobacter chenhuakuii TaxID=2909339 RepID=A0ABY4XJC3_9BACT|nr:hypothetical protein [Dyadobacter chenhuakuii]MCF2496474.1 hypothetical protein [Dyadobacter chenhuakuii]USJ30531.1 hypothetical protein NFI80_22065 [Dyadobacter chenhuakuii]